MFYCDMGEDTVYVTELGGRRKVGRYVIVNGKFVPARLSFQAHTIVAYDFDNQLKWYKHRDRENSAPLTKAEQDKLVFQILQSETW